MFALQNGQAFLLLRAFYAEAKIPGVYFLCAREKESQENQKSAGLRLRAGHETRRLGELVVDN
jgi:hypothetical protein